MSKKNAIATKAALAMSTVSAALMTMMPVFADDNSSVYGEVWDQTFNGTIKPLVSGLVFGLVEAVLAAMLIAQIVKAVREYKQSGEVNLGVIFVMGAAIALVYVMIGPEKMGSPQLLWKFVHLA